MNRPAIKAGLLGGIIAAVIGLLGNLVPLLGCLALPLELLVYAGTGVAAAAWLPGSGRSGSKVGEGAIAGLIAGILSGLASMLVSLLTFSAAGGADLFLRQLPPESLQALQQSGLDPNLLFGPSTIAAVGGLCCGASAVIALGLGALGAALYPSRPGSALPPTTYGPSPYGTGGYGSTPAGSPPAWPPQGPAVTNPTQPPNWGQAAPPYQPPYQAPSPPAGGPYVTPGLPGRNAEEDRALDTIMRFEERAGQGNPANLGALLPFLQDRSPTVRAVAAGTCGEYLAAIAQRPVEQPPAAQAAIDRAIAALFAAAGGETDSSTLTNLATALDRADPLIDPPRLAGTLAAPGAVPLDKVVQGIRALPGTAKRAALLEALGAPGQPPGGGQGEAPSSEAPDEGPDEAPGPGAPAA